MKIVFVVDDNQTNLEAARLALEGKFRVYAIPSAARMFKLLEKIMPDIILLDVDMPEMDGFQAMETLKADNRLKDIPVVFLTARMDEESELKGYEMGALDFINKPFSPPVLVKRIEGHIDTDILIKNSLFTVKRIYNATIQAIAELVESRDRVTGFHIARTRKYLEILVSELVKMEVYEDEIAEFDMDVLISSAQLHDMGKILVSDIILNKPGKLTDEEYETIKTHCEEGVRLVDKIIGDTEEDSFLTHARRFAGAHHERWDGTGYPNGLKGEEIPLEGRIMAIADVYDALVSERPYKKAISHEEAVEIIKKESGTHFDPKIVEAFLQASEDFWVESVSDMSGKG